MNRANFYKDTMKNYRILLFLFVLACPYLILAMDSEQEEEKAKAETIVEKMSDFNYFVDEPDYIVQQENEIIAEIEAWAEGKEAENGKLRSLINSSFIVREVAKGDSVRLLEYLINNDHLYRATVVQAVVEDPEYFLIYGNMGINVLAWIACMPEFDAAAFVGAIESCEHNLEEVLAEDRAQLYKRFQCAQNALRFIAHLKGAQLSFNMSFMPVQVLYRGRYVFSRLQLIVGLVAAVAVGALAKPCGEALRRKRTQSQNAKLKTDQ